MRLLLKLLILINCHIIQGNFEWKVIKKVTDYGQNVTLFCNVPNCCPDDAGWDRWTPRQQTLFIDVKSGRSNKKYDGKVEKDGYTLIIQNLTRQDLNVSYSCLYGVTLGERKLLLVEDVFTYETNKKSKVSTSRSVIAALISGAVLIGAVVVYCLIIKRKGNDKGQDQKKAKYHKLGKSKIESEKGSMESLIKMISVSNTLYSVVYGSEIDIKVQIPDGRRSKRVTWAHNGLPLTTSIFEKYVLGDVSEPSLKIKDLNKADSGVYVGKVLLQAVDGNETEMSSPPIKVELIVPVLRVVESEIESRIEKKVSIDCKILDCPEKCEIYWEKRIATEEFQKLQTNDTTLVIDSLSTKDYQRLTFNQLQRNDAAQYRCCIKYCSSIEKCIFQSDLAKLTVFKEPTVSFTWPGFKFQFGEDAVLRYTIFNWSENLDIVWEKKIGHDSHIVLQTSDSRECKYGEFRNDGWNLIIRNVDKEDNGLYRCCIKYCFSKNRYDTRSQYSQLHVFNEPVVEMDRNKTDVSIGFGCKVSFSCVVRYSPKDFEVFWEKIEIGADTKTVVLECNEQTKGKYEMFDKNNPRLIIKDAHESDAAFYRCVLRYKSSSGGYIHTTSGNARLYVDESKKELLTENEHKRSDRDDITLRNRATTELLTEEETHNISDKDRAIPNNIKEQIRIQIETWKEKDKKFVPTRASDFVIECLRKNSCVTLTGCAGVGKTFIARHTALILQTEGYDIIPIAKPDDIRDYYHPGKQTIFVVDDICGNFNANQNEIEKWKQLLPLVDTIITDTCCKIMVSCRMQVYKDDKFNSLTPFKACECNLISKELSLTLIEKTNIAKSYFGTNEPSIDDLSKKSEFFPLLCSLCYEKKEKNVKDFFRKPFQVYENELKNLSRQGMEGNYKVCSLVLCVLFNNQLEETWFHGKVTDQQRQIIKDICDVCKVDGSTSKATVKEALDTLIGSFISYQIGIYSTLHDKLFDFLAEYFGQQMIECLIEHGDSDLIHGRFIWGKSPDSKTSNPEYIIQIPDNKLKLYIQRLVKDWSAEKVALVFKNINMKALSFRKKLLHYLETLDQSQKETLANINDTVLKTKNYASGNSPLIMACSHGYCNMVEWLVANIGNQIQLRHDGTVGLYVACQEGYLNIVVILLKTKPNMDQCDNNGCSPLFIASQNGHTNIVNMLLEKDPDVDLCDDADHSPLNRASSNGYPDIVKVLLENDADVNLIDNDGISPLYAASQNGHTKIVEILLEKDPDVNQCDNDGNSPLSIASKNKHIDIVKMLLWKNSNVNLCGKDGSSPLYIACQNGETDIVKMILEKNPNTDQHDSDSNSSLYAASQNGYIEIVKMLLEQEFRVDQCNNNGGSPLFVASMNGHTEIVTMLLKNGADVNLCDNDGNCPLMAASEKGHTKIVSLLLEKNSNIDICTKTCSTFPHRARRGKLSYSDFSIFRNFRHNIEYRYGCSSLHMAIWNGHTEIVKLLLENNADVNLCDNEGCSPMYKASLKGHTDMVKLLLEKKVDIDLCDQYGRTPLFMASKGGNTKIVEMLLERKPNVDICVNNKRKSRIMTNQKDQMYDPFGYMSFDPCDKNECSPLHTASKNGHTDIVRLFFAMNSRVEICTKCGRIPLHSACEKGYTDIVRMLLEKGSKFDLVDKNGRSPIYAATKNGHTEIVKILLEKNPNIDQCTNDGRTLLYEASYNGHTEIVRMLLKKGPDVNICNNDGRSPLYVASLNRNSEIVKMLLKQIINVDLCDETGLSPLYLSSQNGYIEIVTMLLEKNPNVDLCDLDFGSPLLMASKNGDTEIVRLLLEKNPNVDLCDNDGNSPLYASSHNGQTDIVRMLLQKNANVDLCDLKGCSPLNTASKNGHSEIVSMLLQKGPSINLRKHNGRSPLFGACNNGHTDIVRMLLEKNPNVDLCDKNCNSPLFIASNNGHTDIVRMLLEKNSNVDLCDKNGNSPLFIASNNGHTDIVRMLLKTNLNVDLCDTNANSPLFAASQNGHTDIVRMLLEKNLNVDLCDTNGNSPLFAASQNGHTETVMMLLETNPNIDQCNNFNSSPLHAASQNGHTETVRRLLLEIPNVDLRDKHGCTSLYYASHGGHTDIVKMLLEKNPNVNLCSLDGFSPLIIASANNHINIIKLLLMHVPDINAQTFDGATALYRCALHGNRDVTQLLIENDANLEICIYSKERIKDAIKDLPEVTLIRLKQHLLDRFQKTKSSKGKDYVKKKSLDYALDVVPGFSPLHVACLMGRTAVVLCLLKNKSNINITSEYKTTPLFHACEVGHQNIVRLLLRYGADTKMCRLDGISPLQIAKENGHSSIVTIVQKHLTMEGELYT